MRVREFCDDVQVDVAPPEYSPPPLGISSISLEEMSRLRTLSTPGSRIEAVLSGMEHLVQARDMFRRAQEDQTASLTPAVVHSLRTSSEPIVVEMIGATPIKETMLDLVAERLAEEE